MILINSKKRANGQNILVCEDAINFLQSLRDNSVNHCITDPPYNISGYDNKKEIGWLKSNKYWTDKKKFSKIDARWDKFKNDEYKKFTEEWLKEIIRILKPNGNIIIFGTYHNIYTIGYILQGMNRKIINSIVWYKRNAFPNITHRMLCESTEYAIWAVNNTQKKATKWIFNYKALKKVNEGKQMRNMWDIPMTSLSEKKLGKHPSQKPIELIKRLVIGASKKDEIIIDPFMGSGTIPLVAKMFDRKFIGVDNNKKYYQLAKKRLAILDKTKTAF